MAETILRFREDRGISGSDFSRGGIAWKFLSDVAQLIENGQPISVVDLSSAVHVKPYIVALVVAACQRLNQHPPIVIPPEDNAVRDHLERLGFSAALGIESARSLASRPTNVPLRVMKDRLDQGFSYRIAELLIGELEESPPPGTVCRISNSIDEMILNALAHSESPIGCVVVAQAFPKKERIEAVVLDLGITIRKHLLRKYPGLADDHEAIRKAIEDGVTGTIGLNGLGETNSGAGLSDLREYAEMSGSEFAILSGKALAAFGPQPIERPFYGGFPGTLINIRFESATAY